MRQPRNEQTVPSGPLGPADDQAPTQILDAPGDAPESVDADADGIHARAWRLVDDDTPRDGTLIEYKIAADQPDTIVQYSRWRITRMRDAATRSWRKVGFWCDPFTNAKLLYQPLVWRMPEGFMAPGMIV